MVATLNWEALAVESSRVSRVSVKFSEENDVII